MLVKTKLKVEPITTNVGGVISGVDLREPMSADLMQQLREAVIDRGVVFFRDQVLTAEEMAAFMGGFGTLAGDPSVTPPTAPVTPKENVANLSTLPVKKATAVWHIDSTVAPAPANFISLRPLVLPSVGGDTCWGSMIAPYETLSEPIRDLVDHLEAEHSTFLVLPLMQGGYSEGFQADMRSIHPVVRVHPETGRKALFVSELWTEKLVGMSRIESQAILKMLYQHACSEEFTMRWKWRLGDVAVWDNRSFQHYAVCDYNETRVLEKIIIEGERPYGPRAA